MKNFLWVIMVTAGLTVTANAFNEAGCARVAQDFKHKIAAEEAKIKKEKDPKKKEELTKEVDALKAKEAKAKAALKDKKYKECVAIR